MGILVLEKVVNCINQVRQSAKLGKVPYCEYFQKDYGLSYNIFLGFTMIFFETFNEALRYYSFSNF